MLRAGQALRERTAWVKALVSLSGIAFIVMAGVFIWAVVAPIPNVLPPMSLEEVMPLLVMCGGGVLTAIVNRWRLKQVETAVTQLDAKQDRALLLSWSAAVATPKVVALGVLGVVVIFIFDSILTSVLKPDATVVGNYIPIEWGTALLVLLSFGVLIQTFTSGREKFIAFADDVENLPETPQPKALDAPEADESTSD